MVRAEATDNNIVRRMRFACWISKTTNALIIFNTYCFSNATMISQTRLNVTLYVHCLCFSHMIPTAWRLLVVCITPRGCHSSLHITSLTKIQSSFCSTMIGFCAFRFEFQNKYISIYSYVFLCLFL
jgi:hypothetical protein